MIQYISKRHLANKLLTILITYDTMYVLPSLIIIKKNKIKGRDIYGNEKSKISKGIKH